MKKVLLAGTALLGVVALSAPAHADIDLDLGGYFSGYGIYVDNDETGTGAAGDDLRKFEFRRDNEIHVSGETTTDQGLTVGVHTEAAPGNTTGTNNPNAGSSLVDETYAYFSGQWGRVNFGVEDGAAYLLQVEAPSADANVDGLRTYVGGVASDLWNDATLDADFAGQVLDYQHSNFRQAERLTYMTPKFNGFQAGVSYAPDNVFDGPGALFANTADDIVGNFENLWEASARWDGEFQGFGISAGGGYSHASTEMSAAAGALGSDDWTTWNGGLNLAWSGFSLGGAYITTNNGIGGVGDEDTKTWTVGGAWDNGPYHVGLSYLDRNYGSNANPTLAGAADLDVTRWTAGAGYTYGPGMSFRGSFMMGEADSNGVARDIDFTQGTIGTQIDF